MKKRIHQILALAAAAALWTGCDDGSDQADDRGVAVAFSCGTEKTRVVETDQDNIASFRVSAVLDRTAAGWGYTDDFMDGQLVERSGGDWVYSPVCYMPMDGSTVDFFAYSPANAPVSDFRIDGGGHDQVTLTYDVTTDAAAQHDFMVADALDKKTSPIFLEFQHMLSSVRVEARAASAGYTFRVNEVKLINICRQGVLKSNTSAADPRETAWAWSDQATPATYTVVQRGAVDIPVSDDYTPVSDPLAGPLMVLPQTLKKGGAVTDPGDITGDAAYVAATYDVFDGGPDPIERNVTYYMPVTDPDAAGGELTFEAGKRYIFHLDLKYPL